MSTTTSTQDTSPDVMTLVNAITTSCTQNTMEAELLRKQCVRKLYKLLGDPTEEDFPDEFKTAGAWRFTKQPGYTSHIQIEKPEFMRAMNNADTDWHIKRPSQTKIAIVERYARGGWHSTVHSMNVICTKYVKHPRFKDVCVEFYSSRDCARYEYVLEKHDEEDD